MRALYGPCQLGAPIAWTHVHVLGAGMVTGRYPERRVVEPIGIEPTTS